MLKITYTDTGLLLEPVAQPLEALVAQRRVLAQRLGQTLTMEATRASLPLPVDLPGMDDLLHLARQTGAIEVDGCDRNWLEITLSGLWIAASTTSEEGIFLAELERPLEARLLSLWRQAQRQHLGAVHSARRSS